MSEKLYLNSGKAKARVDYKNRGRMKLLIKFNQDEAQALKNWTNQVKPPQIDEDTFYKQVFFNGVGALNHQLAEMARKSIKDETVREQLRQAGVDVEKLEQELNNEAVSQPIIPEMPIEEPQLDNGVVEVTDFVQKPKPNIPEMPIEEPQLDNGVVEVIDQVEQPKPSTTQDATDTKN